MNVLLFSLCLSICGLFAGILGALTGLGGGVIIIPALLLIFHIHLHLAMGASLIAVLATSLGAAVGNLKEGYTNVRIGLLLEIGAIIGALIGAMLISFMPIQFLTIVFCIVLLTSAYFTVARVEVHETQKPAHPLAHYFQLNGSYRAAHKVHHYSVQSVPLGVSIMCFAGLLSGLLGIGSGTLKVMAMDQALRLPYKVATATSNFMIGMTAAASASVYFAKGYIHPLICFPIMMGVLLGAYLGGKLMRYIPTHYLRIIFSIVLVLICIQLLLRTF